MSIPFQLLPLASSPSQSLRYHYAGFASYVLPKVVFIPPPPNTLCLIVIMISIQIPFHKWFRPHPPSALGGGRQKLVNVSSQDTRLDKDRIICGIEHLERLSFVDRTSGTWLYLLDVHVQNLFFCSLSEPGISS